MSDTDTLAGLSSIIRVAAPAPETCEGCAVSRKEGNDLTCHRNPPQMAFLALPAPPPRVGQMMVQAFSGFPIVQPGQWCAQFAAKRRI